MTHNDNDLARLVGRDIERYLDAVPLAGPAFAVALWIDDGCAASDATARYGLSVGADTDLDSMRVAPAYRDVSDEQWLHWPTSERWNSGNWSHLVEDFLSPDTERALEPLREQIRGEHAESEIETCDFSWPCSCQAAGARRWFEIGSRAVALGSLPRSLPTTADVLVYAEGPELTCAQRALAMLRTITPDRLHQAFPAWQRMARAARSAREDDALMARLRIRVDRERAGDPGAVRFPTWHEPPLDEFTGLLMACDLHWYDVATWSDHLRNALRVADSR